MDNLAREEVQDPNRMLDDAIAYVALNLKALSTQVLKVADGEIMPEGCELSVLHSKLGKIVRHPVRIAEVLVAEAAMRYVRSM